MSRPKRQTGRRDKLEEAKRARAVAERLAALDRIFLNARPLDADQGRPLSAVECAVLTLQDAADREGALPVAIVCMPDDACPVCGCLHAFREQWSWRRPVCGSCGARVQWRETPAPGAPFLQLVRLLKIKAEVDEAEGRLGTRSAAFAEVGARHGGLRALRTLDFQIRRVAEKAGAGVNDARPRAWRGGRSRS